MNVFMMLHSRQLYCRIINADVCGWTVFRYVESLRRDLFSPVNPTAVWVEFIQHYPKHQTQHILYITLF